MSNPYEPPEEEKVKVRYRVAEHVMQPSELIFSWVAFLIIGVFIGFALFEFCL